MLTTKRKISDLEWDEIHHSRPLLSYTGYSDAWTSVQVIDRQDGWQWGKGPYYDWCDANCTDRYNIVKYDHNTVYGRFRSPADATAFALRWMT